MFDPKARTLEGKKGLVVGIANDKSIAYGCARGFKFLQADDLAITYLNEKARPYVQPLAEEMGASIARRMDSWPQWRSLATRSSAWRIWRNH